MANDQDIAFNLDVNTSGGAKSMADLKKEFKELQKELSATTVGTKEYQLALQKLGAVKDDIGDLRDTINALNPEGKVAAFAKVGSTIASGFAAAQGAAALFGSKNKELEESILKVQAAMALAEGIKGITAAADAFEVLNAVMLANPIAAIVVGFSALAVAAIAVYNNFFKAASASEDLGNQLVRVDEENKHINASLKAQITALSGLKENEQEILALKEEGFKLDIERNKLALQVALAKQAEAEASTNLEEQLLRAGGQEKAADLLRFARLKEQREATTSAIETLKQSIAGLQEFHNTAEQKKLDVTKEANKQAVDDYKRHLKEIEDAQKKHDDDLYQQHLNEVALFEQQHKDEAEAAKQKDIDDRAAIDASNAEDNEKSQIIADQKVEVNRKTEEQIRAERQKTFDTTVNGTGEAVKKTQAIFDLYFQWQLKQNKGNAQAERDIRKKQFNVNKAFGVAGSIIDGVGAIQKALNNPYPLNIILAVLTGVLATANTIKIATAKFDDSGGSSGSAGDIGTTAQAPVVPQPNNTVTQISDDGKVTPKDSGPQKVFVLEGDITKSTKKVANIEETAKIG